MYSRFLLLAALTSCLLVAPAGASSLEISGVVVKAPATLKF